MCTLLWLPGILTLAGGFLALVLGKVRLTKTVQLEGWRAKIGGVFLMIPLPLGYLAGLAIGLFTGTGLDQITAAIIQLMLVLIGTGIAGILALSTKPDTPTIAYEDPVSPANEQT